MAEIRLLLDGLQRGVLPDGMYALASWDPQTRQLTLLRDRFGIKPLYYSYQPERGLLAFASEPQALLHLLGGAPRRRRAIAQVDRRRRAAGRPDPVPAGPSAAARRGVALRSLPRRPRLCQRQRLATAPASEVDSLDEQLGETLERCRQTFRPCALLVSGGVDSNLLGSYLDPQLQRFHLCLEGDEEKPAATPSAATLRAAPGSLHAAAASRGRQLRRGDTDVQPADVPAPGRRYRRAGLSLRASRRRRRRTVLGLPAPSRTLAPARAHRNRGASPPPGSASTGARPRCWRNRRADGSPSGSRNSPTRPSARASRRRSASSTCTTRWSRCCSRRPSADVAHHRSAHPLPAWRPGAARRRRLQQIVGDTAKAPLVALLEQREKRWQAQPKRHFRLPFERWPQAPRNAPAPSPNACRRSTI
ncbi:asparagine synthase-related protein [Pseudomonas aeruginosa]|nr:asparagine synthase-related protein [Pseudomonas aeruginosa]